MKKKIALGLASAFAVLTLAACAGGNSSSTPVSEPASEPAVSEPADSEPAGDDVAVMSHDEYAAAAMDSEVVVETYVQATQSWWDNQITIYAQSPDGAYFIYNAACSEEDAAKLVPGTPIRVTGFKSEWSGEVEIVDGAIEILDGSSFIAEATDVTDLLGTDELIDHQNEFVTFTGLTVESIAYKNDEPGDDIYVTLSLGDNTFDFCVEFYLTGTETEVYTAVGELKAGDVVDIEGFLYWYEGPNTHITAVNVVG